MILHAPAKINLILRVINRRDDGYHNLQTWMQKIDLYDVLKVEILQQATIEVQCSNADVPEDENNLVWRAAELFFSKSVNAKGMGARIYLEKHIPVSAGLGGGSSDAGTLLKYLNSHFGQEFGTSALIEMGKSLGADVPFFVTDMTSVMATGIGDIMEPAEPMKNCTFILVNPGISVSTASIFAKYALTIAEKNSTLTGSRKLRAGKLSGSDLQNDLEAVTIEMYPIVAEIKNTLGSLGAAYVLMSGSGPTVFGIFKDIKDITENIIEDAVGQLRKTYGNKIYVAQS